MKQLIFTLALTSTLAAGAAPALDQVLPGRYLGRVPGTGATCHVDITMERGRWLRQLWLTVKARDAESEMTHEVKLSKLTKALKPNYHMWEALDRVESGNPLKSVTRPAPVWGQASITASRSAHLVQALLLSLITPASSAASSINRLAMSAPKKQYLSINLTWWASPLVPALQTRHSTDG